MATKLLSPWQCGIFSRISGVSSHPSSLTFLRGLCSEETNSVSKIPPIESQSPLIESDAAPNVNAKDENAVGGVAEDIPRRTPRGKYPPKPEKSEDIICRMMANREWTTRLQRSIRELVPEFDHSLVWNVLHGARNSKHALQFFRWVVKTGYRHDQSTHLKIIQILGRTQKLNHARCILFDMPKMGVEWDEEFFIALISSYGQAGIVQESVKMFRKMKELGVERTIKSYDALFKVIMRRGRYLMAKWIFNEMLREGVMPIRHTYNILLWGFFLVAYKLSLLVQTTSAVMVAMAIGLNMAWKLTLVMIVVQFLTILCFIELMQLPCFCCC